MDTEYNLDTKYKFKILKYTMEDYLKSMVNKVFKLLPMYEKKDETLSKYFVSLMNEIGGGNELLCQNKYLLELINNLEGLMLLDNHEEFRAKVFKCINIINSFDFEK